MVRLVMVAAMCAGMAAAQSGQDAGTNTSCVDRLEMPVYPPLAQQARISGDLTVTVAINADGTIHTALPAGAHRILSSAVENAVQASVFRKECRGKSVTLVFNFVVAGQPDGKPQRVSFGYPNQFWITVPPARMNVD